MLRPGHVLQVEIDRLSLGGEGVARSEGVVLFIPYTAPGDRVEIEILEAKARFARGRVRRVIRASSDRTTPPCRYHFRPDMKARFCGGCSWQHLTYDAQLTAKRRLVQETLERLGNLRDISVKPVLGMAEPWRYRNKVQQPVGREGNRLVSGFYLPGTHQITPIDDCLVQPELSVAVVNRAKQLLEEHHVAAYDASQHRGWIRHLIVRTSSQGQALLVFVTRTLDFPNEQAIIGELRKQFPALAGLFQNVQPAQSNVILGRQWRTLAGAEAIEERLGAFRFRMSPASFFQVNSVQAEVLYNVAARFAGQGHRLLDLYSGVGTIALWLAKQFREVGGVEEVEAAVDDATKNAETNKVDNAYFQAAPVEVFLKQLDRQTGGASLTVTLDPPRAGCDPQVIRHLIRLAPQTIVYVSCDPGTLARDLKMLCEGGYRVRAVQPVDLFPQTSHIETVVQLTR